MILLRKRIMRTGIIMSLVLLSLVIYRITWTAGQPVSAPVKRELPIYNVQTPEKKIAISFDAAWGTSYTEKILDILDTYNIKTTFFLVGFWIDKNPEQVKEIARRGHEIGNHSDTHPHMTEISADAVNAELTVCNAKIEGLTGVAPKLFRPPFGDYNNDVINASRSIGVEPIQWSVDSLDWKDLSANDIFTRVTGKIAPGDIVLFHNNSLHIADALPLVLEKLTKDGFQIVPISELLLTGDTVIDSAGKQKPAE